jgi:septal ring factor EnvC (AmiA/AmiB activator)
MKSMLRSSLLLTALLVGCSDQSPQDVPADAPDPFKQMTAELERLKKTNSDLSEANATLSSNQRRLRDENAALTKANFDLTQKQESMQQDNRRLTAQVRDEMNARAEVTKELCKERFALLPPSEQKQVLGNLEKLNADQPLTLVEIQALVNNGMVERDDPRYLKAKEAEQSAN